MKGGFYSRGEIEGIVQKIRSPHMDFGAGKVFFVDGQAGSDGYAGDDPEKPMKTIAAALAKCVSYRGDYILVLRGGGQTYPIAVAVDRVHIIGVTNPGTPQSVGGFLSGAAICMTIDASHVEIAGLTLLADATHPSIDLLGQCWGLWVHHCNFGEGAASLHGIFADNEGPVGGLIEHNVFGELIAENGCHLLGPTRTRFRRNLFRCINGVGIKLAGGNFAEIFENVFVGHNVPGDAITVTGAGGIVAHNYVGYLNPDAIGYVPFVDGGTNHWVDNICNAVIIGPT